MSDVTPEKRLAEVAVCLLTGKVPDRFFFNMATYGRAKYVTRSADGEMRAGPRCGTSGCVAGLTVEMYGSIDIAVLTGSDILVTARNFLGLTDTEAHNLFHPDESRLPLGTEMHQITELQAGRTLARFAKTGKVNWALLNRPIEVNGVKF